MKKYNLKSIITGLIVVIVGILLIVADAFWWMSGQMVWIGIGCSLIASALVILLNAFLVEIHIVSPLDEWKLKTITSTRAEINCDCENEMKGAKKQIDIIAFGLRSFRTAHTDKEVLNKLNRGTNYRILTMKPDSDFVLYRQIEENNKNIQDSINELVSWANEINKQSRKGKIVIKGYSAMTLDFYWRVDEVLYIGPYWYGYESQQTITYKYEKGGKGFRTYTAYFDKLWNNSNLVETLTSDNKRKNGK